MKQVNKMVQVEDFNIDTWDQTDYSFRDKQRNRKIGWEHCLFAKGQGIYDLAQEKNLYMRDAAYVISINRVVNAVKARGWV